MTEKKRWEVEFTRFYQTEGYLQIEAESEDEALMLATKHLEGGEMTEDEENAITDDVITEDMAETDVEITRPDEINW